MFAGSTVLCKTMIFIQQKMEFLDLLELNDYLGLGTVLIYNFH